MKRNFRMTMFVEGRETNPLATIIKAESEDDARKLLERLKLADALFDGCAVTKFTAVKVEEVP